MGKLALDGGKPVRPKDQFLVFGAPFIGQEEIDEVVDSMRRRWIGTGPKVHRFEEAFRTYKGARHAAAVNSCTAALHLAMQALGIGRGDEVITSAMTFCATVNAIIHCGATPVLVDCDRETMNLIPEEVERKLTPRTRAIVPVHFAGRACEMEAIEHIARSNGLRVIEDCAHAIETSYRGRSAGRFGQIGCFSFYATKNVVTGEGGMILTDDDAIAARVRILALHGMSADAWSRYSDSGYKHYDVVEAGFKYNMMDIQAAMGIHQLKRVEESLRRRVEIWDRYNRAFESLACVTPRDPEPDTVHARHLYTILVATEELGKSRDWVLGALTAENIGVGVHYRPIQAHPFYQRTFGWQSKDFPNADWVGSRTVSLPLSAALTNEDVEDVITAVRKVLG